MDAPSTSPIPTARLPYMGTSRSSATTSKNTYTRSVTAPGETAGNLYPSADRFPAQTGRAVRLVGNARLRAQPHLHFEIRDSRTQRTLNTISSGVIRTRDDIPPRLVKLYYVEVDSVRGVPVHARHRPVELVEKTPGRYALKQEGALSVGGRGYFILEATDRKNDVSNTFGLWRIREFADECRSSSFVSTASPSTRPATATPSPTTPCRSPRATK